MSVLLNAEKIISCARQAGIHNKAQLDQKMAEIRAEVDADGAATRAGSRAWDGFAISESNAELLAQALEVPNLQILKHNTPPPWIALRNDTSRHQKIISLEIKGSDHNQLFELDTKRPEDEHTLKITDKWRLNLTFKPGCHLIVLIRNESKHMIITPNANNTLPTQWQDSQLYIPPEKYIGSPKSEGGGLREIIVIACTQDIFPQLSQYEDNIFSRDDRNTLATKLQASALKEKYWIDSYAFFIHDPGEEEQT